MKLLIFGGEGQLGHDIIKRARELNFQVASPVFGEVDIRDREQVAFLVKKLEPDRLINCAAYTAVDTAEEERDNAFAVNHQGVANIASAIKGTKCRVIHISTDYVFDGNFSSPIKEEQETNPLNVYGESKSAGEKVFLSEIPDQSLVVRTSSLHGAYGDNFVHTMLQLFCDREEISVVNDQLMSPTWAGWLAEVCLDLIRLDNTGIINASCAGEITWFDFAKAIYELSATNFDKINKDLVIKPVTSENFPRPAKRPQYSVLDCSKLTSLLGREPMVWSKALQSHLEEIEYGKRVCN